MHNGATTHIVHDLRNFTKFDTQFNPEKHFIELADGKRSNNVAQRRGDAEVEICDVKGKTHRTLFTFLLTSRIYSQSMRQSVGEPL